MGLHRQEQWHYWASILHLYSIVNGVVNSLTVFFCLFNYKKIANFGRCLGWNSLPIVVVCLWLVPHITSISCITTLWLIIFSWHGPKTKKKWAANLCRPTYLGQIEKYWPIFLKKTITIQCNIRWQNSSLRVLAMPKANTRLYTTCAWWMRSQLSVWCVQAVPVSGCGVGDYSSVMRWMVVGVVCIGRDMIVWQFYRIVLRLRCHTVHQMSAGPVDIIRVAGRGLAQNWCVVDRTPSWDGVRQTGDDGSTEHVLQSGVVQSSGPQDT